jgi:hypothetical protein
MNKLEQTPQAFLDPQKLQHWWLLVTVSIPRANCAVNCEQGKLTWCQRMAKTNGWRSPGG